MKNSRIIFALMGILTLFLISGISAQSLIAGKIYGSSYNEVGSAAVVVTCNSNVLETTSLSDGTYAVRFDSNLCGESSSVSVSATKDSMSGNDNGIVSICNPNEQTCPEVLIAIVNVMIKASSSGDTGGGGGGGGGGSHKYYLCGNGVCNTGETNITCPKDCNVTKNSTIILTSENNQNAENNETANEEEKAADDGITGAVTGTAGTSGKIIILIAVIILVLGGIIMFIVNKRRNASPLSEFK